MAKTEAKKPTYPSRPCPKCGEPIHIKSRKHTDCGWVAEDVSAAAPKLARTEGGNGKSMSNMEAVRIILADKGNDTMPRVIQEELKSRFNIVMEPGAISSYKSLITKKGHKKGRKASAAPAPSTHSAHKQAAGSSVSFDDIKAVKGLAERIGVVKLQQLAELLAH
jgi:hypothetical protein